MDNLLWFLVFTVDQNISVNVYWYGFFWSFSKSDEKLKDFLFIIYHFCVLSVFYST